MENTNKCPCCSHHCDINNLQCKKGEAYFNGESVPSREGQKESHRGHHGEARGESRHQHRGEGRCKNRHERNEEGCCKNRHEHHEEGCCESRRERDGEGRGRKQRRPEFPEGSLADLMSKCGHRLFHGGDDTMFVSLTEDEQASLKQLLTKLLSAD